MQSACAAWAWCAPTSAATARRRGWVGEGGVCVKGWHSVARGQTAGGCCGRPLRSTKEVTPAARTGLLQSRSLHTCMLAQAHTVLPAGRRL